MYLFAFTGNVCFADEVSWQPGLIWGSRHPPEKQL
jgi:hypothetical protein